MHQYSKVLSYIDYFSTSGEEEGTRVHIPPNMPYVHYSPEILSFIDDVYQTDLLGAGNLLYWQNHHKIIELARQVRTYESYQRYNPRLHTPPQRVIYDYKGSDVALALALDEIIRRTKKAEWRIDLIKELEVKRSIRSLVSDPEQLEKIFELSMKPEHCLEFIMANELLHLLEKHHNDNFNVLMDKYLPNLRVRKDVLNRFPLSREEWEY